MIPTGRYLLKQRIAKTLPKSLRRGPMRGFEYVRLTMDLDCIQADGRSSLWPIYEAWEQLAEWVDVNQLSQTYTDAVQGESMIPMVPLKKIQSVQTLAFRLLDAHDS